MDQAQPQHTITSFQFQSKQKQGVLLFLGNQVGQISVYLLNQQANFLFKWQIPSQQEVSCIGVSRFHSKFLCGDILGNIYEYSMVSKQLELTYLRHQQKITGLKYYYFQNTDHFVSGSMDSKIIVWHGKNGIYLVLQAQSPVISIDISPDNSYVSYCTVQGEFVIQTLVGEGNRVFTQWQSITDMPFYSQFNPKEFQIVVANQKGGLVFQDMQTNIIQAQLELNGQELLQIQFWDQAKKVYAISKTMMYLIDSFMNVGQLLESSLLPEQCLGFFKPKKSSQILFLVQENSAQKINKILVQNLQTKNIEKVFELQNQSNKQSQVQSIEQIIKDHDKIINIQNERIEGLNEFVNSFFVEQNFVQAEMILRQQKNKYIINDIVQCLMKNKGLSKMNVNLISALLCQWRLLLKSKLKNHILNALWLIGQSLIQLSEETIQIKRTPLMDKYDFAWEKRLEKYNEFISLIQSVYQDSSIKELSERYQGQEIGDESLKVHNLLQDFFQKLNKK